MFDPFQYYLGYSPFEYYPVFSDKVTRELSRNSGFRLRPPKPYWASRLWLASDSPFCMYE
jgi:hypothetical protein